MAIAQITPFSLFLHDNMDMIRNPFMSPDNVIKIAEEIWEHIPHQFKFSYFKKAHDIFIERNQEKQSIQNNENNYDENISIRNMIKNLYNIEDGNENNNNLR
jgi:hypothetical protein